MRLDEVENGIVSGYEVLQGNAPDTHSFTPAVENHKAMFGRAPKLASADRGFFSAQNEREAKELGVNKVALQACGHGFELRRRHDAGVDNLLPLRVECLHL